MNLLVEGDILDNGGRRLGIERRQLVYSDYVLSRRMTKERRSGRDRRSGKNRRDKEIDLEILSIAQRRKNIERRKADREIFVMSE